MILKKIQFWVPITVIAGILIHCWITIISEDYIPAKQHYLGLLAFVALVIYAFINQRRARFGIVFYLLAGILGAFAITPDITKTRFGVGPLTTPPMQMTFVWILILFVTLNFADIVNYYLDSKEAANAKKFAAKRKPGDQ